MGWGGQKGGKDAGWVGQKGVKDAYSASAYSQNDVMFALEVMGAIGDSMGKGNMGGMMGMKGGKGSYDGYEGSGKGKAKGWYDGYEGAGKGKGEAKGGKAKGWPTQGKAKGGKAKGWPTQDFKAKGPALELPWKTRLAQAYSQEHRQPPTKGTIVYTAVPVEGAGFMCTLSCDKFSSGYETEEVHDSEKAAVEAVSMAALKGEFPKAYDEVPASVKQRGESNLFLPGSLKVKGATPAQQAAKAAAAAGGAASKKTDKTNGTGAVKRKDPPSSDAKTPSSDAKSRLNSGFAILAARPLTKADFEYAVAEVNGSSVATLTLNCVEEGSTSVFEGEPAPGTSPQSKKQAEQNAAAAALQQYQDQIDAKMPEHKANQEQRKAEKEAKNAVKKARCAEPDGLE